MSRSGKRKFLIESMRGSCPLKLEHIEFREYSYRGLTLEEKLVKLLSYILKISDFSQYAGKTILNNIYMDLTVEKVGI